MSPRAECLHVQHPIIRCARYVSWCAEFYFTDQISPLRTKCRLREICHSSRIITHPTKVSCELEAGPVELIGRGDPSRSKSLPCPNNGSGEHLTMWDT